MIKHYSNIAFFILSIAITCFFFNDSPWLNTILASLFALFFVILSFGILFLRYNYFLPAICKLENGKVLLTFDDGPDENLTPKILEILNKHQVGALFFIIGKKARNQPTLISEITNQGHVLGNHTQNHSHFFTFFGTKRVVQEMSECNQTIEFQTGDKMAFFRPPIGYTNPNIARGVAQINSKMRFKVIGWTFRSYDTIFRNPERLKNRLLKGIAPNKIVLLHDNLIQTAEMLDDFILRAKKNGIIFVKQGEINTLFK